LLRYPHGGASPTGRVIEFSAVGDLGVDTEISSANIISRTSSPPKFLMKRARAKPVSESQRAGREDSPLAHCHHRWRTARDFDDAVTSSIARCGWHLQVHIADVAITFEPPRLSTAKRVSAHLRLFPDPPSHAPEALSNGMCSLKPAKIACHERAMEFDAAGHMKSSRMTSGVIRSRAHDYTNVNKVLEGDPEMSKRYASLSPRFRDMKNSLWSSTPAAMNALHRLRFPEPVIEFTKSSA